jgi:hypothetical protein
MMKTKTVIPEIPTKEGLSGICKELLEIPDCLRAGRLMLIAYLTCQQGRLATHDS